MSALPAALPLSPLSAQPTVWLSREQAAAYITQRIGVLITSSVLANKASEGNGPPYRIWGGRGGLGRGGRGRYAVYKPADLDAWIETQFHEPLAKASTPNGSDSC